MPSTYERYAAFRSTELTEEERAVRDASLLQEEELAKNPPPEKDRRPNGYMADGRFILNPMMKFYVTTAMERAETQMDSWVYPEEENVCDRYPGIDPREKYSGYEMAFAQREMAIRAALTVRPKEIREMAGAMLDMTQDKTRSNVFKDLHDHMRQDSCFIRRINRGAKLCLDPTASEHMEKNAVEHARRCQSFQEYNRFLTGLEQMCGIRKELFSPEMVAFFKERLGVTSLPNNLEELMSAPNVQPASLQVEFANFDHQMEQRFFSSPHNWGKQPKDMRELKPEEPGYQHYVDLTNASMEAYAIETAARTMDPLFARLEERRLYVDDLRRSNKSEAANYSNMVNRGNLIIVGGQTVKERMQADYRNEHIEEPFEDWYRKNLRERTGAYVSAALMAGQRVEAFIPDEKGKLPKEPLQVTKTGYEPSPLKKVTMNAWERHFSKYGFFKKKLEKVEAYNAALAARERVRDEYANARMDELAGGSSNMKDLFFAEVMEREGFERGSFGELGKLQPERPKPGLSLTRAAATDLCIAHMVAQGYDIHDIIDPNKLVKERLETGNLCMERLKAGDYAWQGKTMFEGHEKMMDVMKELTAGVDMRDANARREILPELGMVAKAVFDLNQEYAKRKEEYFQAAHDKGYNDKMINELLDRQDSPCTFVDDMMHLQRTESRLRKPTSQWNLKNEDPLNLVAGALYLSQVSDGNNLEEQLNNCHKFTNGLGGANYRPIASASAEFKSFREILPPGTTSSNDPKLKGSQEALHQAAMSGKLAGGLITGTLKITLDERRKNPVSTWSSVVGDDGRLAVREEVKEVPREEVNVDFRIEKNLSKKLQSPQKTAERTK